MKATVIVHLKSGILDPQGEAVKGALQKLGHGGVHSVRVGKIIELDLDDDATEDDVRLMADELLANPVMESFTVVVNK